MTSQASETNPGWGLGLEVDNVRGSDFWGLRLTGFESAGVQEEKGLGLRIRVLGSGLLLKILQGVNLQRGWFHKFLLHPTHKLVQPKGRRRTPQRIPSGLDWGAEDQKVKSETLPRLE